MASRSNERRPSMLRTPRPGRPDLVSEALRQLWASAESDPVPDEFLALLDRLDSVRANPTGPVLGPVSGPVSGDDGAA